jgi:hypothetical protein
VDHTRGNKFYAQFTCGAQAFLEHPDAETSNELVLAQSIPFIMHLSLVRRAAQKTSQRLILSSTE